MIDLMIDVVLSFILGQLATAQEDYLATWSITKRRFIVATQRVRWVGAGLETKWLHTSCQCDMLGWKCMKGTPVQSQNAWQKDAKGK